MASFSNLAGHANLDISKHKRKKLITDKQKVRDGVVSRYSTSLLLEDGLKTKVHIVRYSRAAVNLRLVTFARPTVLLDWCEENDVSEAINGGFYDTPSGKLLGDYWIDGQKLPAVRIGGGWQSARACLHIDEAGDMEFGARRQFPARPSNLMHAGPLLVSDRKKVVSNEDTEGLSDQAGQFDSDITLGRYPRAALGFDEQYIWSVAADGRGEDDAGLTLPELGEVMLSLGAKQAISLDGGSSASLISGGRLINKSRGAFRNFDRGRPVLSALVFS